jgi:hypothetical protein
MKAGVWNLVFGLVGVALGLSGQFVLLGTSSSGALAAVGGVLAAWGLVQIVRSRRQQ